MLFIKIAGFFTWSENITFTRIIKIFLRFSSDGGLLLVYLAVLSKGYVISVLHKHTLAPLFYLGYLFLGFCSLLWSSNWSYSLLQLFMTSETILFVYVYLVIISTLNHHHPTFKVRLSKIFAHSIVVMIFGFLVGMFVAPDIFFRLTHGGDVARLGGFIMNPNELGMLAVVGIAACFSEIVETDKKWQNLFLAAILLYGLLMTSSRSSLGSFLLVVGLFVLKYGSFKLKFASVVGAALLLPVAVQKIILKQGDLEEVLSMTGRLPFWKALITEGLPKEPWLGYGFMRIAYGDYFQSVHTYAAKMTHNTFIQVLLNLGFIGFMIVLAQMALTFRACYLSNNSFYKIFFIAIFIPIFVNSLTEFGIFGENNFGILFYQFLIFVFVVHYNPHLSLRKRIRNRQLTPTEQ